MSSAAVTPAARLRGLKPDWLHYPKVWRTEILAGLVVALTLIPEAISFSIIAGVIQVALGPALGDGRLRQRLAILNFMAQVPEMRDVPWAVYPLIIGGLALMVFFPR
ncbi:sodium-independent anion transporter, partial [Streptomyces bacillaris]